MRIRLRSDVIKENYLLQKKRYNKILEGIIDLYNINDSGFARHNPKISKYCLKKPENLIQSLIFCVASQGVSWNVVAPLYRKMYQKLLRDGTLYIKGKEDKLKYEPEGWKELLGILGASKIRGIDYMWKNQKEIFSTTKSILKDWHYEDTSEESKDAVMRLFDYFVSLPQLGIAKAGFAVQLITGALGCFDSVNAQLFANENIPQEIRTELMTPDNEIRKPRKGSYENRLKRLKAYSVFFDLLGTEVKKPTSERLWDIWVTIVADRIRNMFGSEKQSDRPTILKKGDEEIAKLDPYHTHTENPDIADWEKEHSTKMTPDLVSAQHHPTYLAYGEYTK